MDNEELLTVQQVATILEVSDGAIRKAILQGHLACEVKYGRKLITREALTEYQKRTRPDGVKPKGRPKKQPIVE